MGRARTVAVVLALATFVAACGRVGSGDIVTESRSVGEFTAVDASGGIDLELTIEPGAEPEVTVTFDDNIVDRVKTEVEDGTLRVEPGSNYRISGGGRFVSVVVPSLSHLEASGGSDVVGRGEADTMSVDAGGGADVDLSELVVGEMEVDTSGGSDVVVNVTGSVVGDASGGSDVTVVGNPQHVDIETSGGADVHS